MNNDQTPILEPVTDPKTEPEERLTVTEFIQKALEKGIHPSRIRRELQKIGIRWQYSFTYHDAQQARRISHQGRRECARRKEQFCICEHCGEPIGPGPNGEDPRELAEQRGFRMCEPCLELHWRVPGTGAIGELKEVKPEVDIVLP